jgi:hypothetical protein
MGDGYFYDVLGDYSLKRPSGEISDGSRVVPIDTSYQRLAVVLNFIWPPSFNLCKMIQRKLIQKTVSKLKSCYGTTVVSIQIEYNDFTATYSHASKGCRVCRSC